MSVQSTSLKAYYGEILPSLGAKQEEVLEVLLTGEYTNSELAQRLNRPINTITPRVFELRAKELVVESEIRNCKVTGRKAKVWKLNDQIRKERTEPIDPRDSRKTGQSLLEVRQVSLPGLAHLPQRLL